MTKYITDIDVNFVNEMIFDYVFCGHFITTSNTIIPALRDNVTVQKLKKMGHSLDVALK
jgi:hypothetical protein